MTEDFSQLCKDLEHWETDPWAAEAILKKEIMTQFVVDSCVGSGILSRAVARAGYDVASYDIHDWGYPDTQVEDFLQIPKGRIHDEEKNRPFSVFMNPPFSKAVKFVEHSLHLGARKIVCFQRFAWRESSGRRDFWERNPPNRVYICGDRATCWRHDVSAEKRKSMGNSPTAHAWFVWERGHPPGTLTSAIYKRDLDATS